MPPQGMLTTRVAENSAARAFDTMVKGTFPSLLNAFGRTAASPSKRLRDRTRSRESDSSFSTAGYASVSLHHEPITNTHLECIQAFQFVLEQNILLLPPSTMKIKAFARSRLLRYRLSEVSKTHHQRPDEDKPPGCPDENQPFRAARQNPLHAPNLHHTLETLLRLARTKTAASASRRTNRKQKSPPSPTPAPHDDH